MLRRRTVRTTAVVAPAVAALLLAGCSGDEPAPGAAGDTTPASASSPAESPTEGPGDGDGLAAQEAEQIVAQSQAALAKQKSFRMEGEGESDGEQFSIDMAFAAGKGAEGTIGVAGQTLEILFVNQKTYVRASDAFLSQLGLSEAQAATFKGKWLLFPASQAAEFEQFTDGKKLAQEFFNLEDRKVSKGETKEIDGVPAVAIIDEGKDGGTLWIATEGEPLPLLVEPDTAGGDTGSVRFYDYGADVGIEPPAAADVVDLQKLFAGGGR